jgi:hypothetical protein
VSEKTLACPSNLKIEPYVCFFEHYAASLVDTCGKFIASIYNDIHKALLIKRLEELSFSLNFHFNVRVYFFYCFIQRIRFCLPISVSVNYLSMKIVSLNTVKINYTYRANTGGCKIQNYGNQDRLRRHIKRREQILVWPEFQFQQYKMSRIT